MNDQGHDIENPLMVPSDELDPEREVQVWRHRVRSTFICILDTGCWLENSRHFGLLVGNTVALLCYDEASAKKSRYRAVGEPTLERILAAVPRIGLIDHETLLPFSVRDSDAGKNGILTAPESAVLLLPDTHLGLRDVADDFARRDNGSNLQDLVDLVTGIRAVVGNENLFVVQTGDFHDIWEAEVYPTIYFDDEYSRGKMWGPGRRTPYMYRKDRRQRARMAVELICRRWAEAPGNMYEKMIEMIDAYVLGNHDSEWKILGDLGLSPQLKIAVSGTRTKGDITWTLHRCERKGVWRAEHGHRWDEINNTVGCMTADEIMKKVEGKSVSFQYARSERLGDYPALQYSDDGYSINDPLEGAQFKGSLFQLGPEVEWMRDIRRYVEGKVIDWGPWFARVRRNIVEDLAVQLARANPGSNIRVALKGSVDATEYGSAYFLSMSRERPMNLPLRVFVHSHTHRPTLARIKIKHYVVGQDVRLHGYHHFPRRD